jgi:hypothetical protein
MRSRHWLLAVAALLLASCDGGGTTEPTPPPTLTLSIDALSLHVGEEATLTATYNDPGGELTPGITWRSTASGVVSVTPGGVVRGVSPGEAKIIASAGGVADTADVTVTPPISADCGTTGLSFAVGEVRTMTAAEAAALCLSGGSGSEFTVIVSDTGSAPVLVSAAATGTMPASGPPNPDRIPRTGLFTRASRPAYRNFAFDRNLREVGQRLIRDHAAAARRSMQRGDLIPSGPRAALLVGDALTIKVDTATNCTSAFETHNAHVVAVGAHSIIVEDNANPAGGLSSGQYQQVAATFDNQIWASDTENFGTPQDLDQNGKVILFYTKAVNKLTPDDPNDDSFVGGYFFSGDVLPVSSCPSSNGGEIFYLLVPDPNGEVNNNPFGADFVIKQTESTVAHEFEHLINAERRIYVNNATVGEATFLDEGLAHIAEELLFYKVTGIGPRENIDVQALRDRGAIEAANTFQLSNFGRFKSYVEDPDANGPFEPDDDDLETRGAIWAFLRYAVDRKNGDDRTYWFNLVNSTTKGTDNLTAVLGVDLGEWLGDFLTTNYTDDAIAGVDARFTQPSWDFRDLVSAISDPQVYPLDTRTLSHGSNLSLNLSDEGGTAYLRTAVAAGGVGSIKLTTSGGPVPARVRVTVVRTK